MDESRINDIISQYPYPIAILYRIVAGLDLKEEPGKGVEYILQTAESTARLLGMMAVAELALLKENNGVGMPNSIKTDFKKHLKRPSFGIWYTRALHADHPRAKERIEVFKQWLTLHKDDHPKAFNKYCQNKTSPN